MHKVRVDWKFFFKFQKLAFAIFRLLLDWKYGKHIVSKNQRLKPNIK